MRREDTLLQMIKDLDKRTIDLLIEIQALKLRVTILENE